MTTAQIAKAILGAGDVRFDLYDPTTQTWGGLGDVLEAEKFEITPDSDKKEKLSKSRAAYGQPIAAVIIGKPTKVAITISAASAETMAMQMAGTTHEDSQGAGAISNTITAKLEKWAKLSKRNISDTGFAVKDEAGTTTYAKGTDYQVNYATGEIKPLAAGDIDADQVLTVTGTALAWSATVVVGSTRPQIRVRAVYEGVNQVDGQEIECEVWEAVLSPKKGFDFLASDFSGIELEGTAVVPEGKTGTHEVRFKHA